ncbi:MAG: glycosyltransferase family 39 protein [Gemmatimonadaceae bacterium]|nr:glycosyltransferase family 39 protein [Gemmatimonadaceae bacterium]
MPLWHDEAAYRLQAEIFARGRWTMPAPALGEFFDQMYVLVSPVFAAKYPPGHSLLLALGALFGVPAGAAVLLTALAGGLLFALVRRVAGPWVAALAFLLWLTQPLHGFRATFLSETTSALCWLVAWWGLLDWRERPGARGAIITALAIGWGAITRPATMFAFAIPVAIVMLLFTVRTRRWRELAVGLAVGTVTLGILPLWGLASLGSVSRTPLAEYQAQVMPFDYPGWREPTARGTRVLPPVQAQVVEYLREIKADQVHARPLDLLRVRAWAFLGGTLGGWRSVLVPFVLLGALAGGVPALLSVASTACLLLVYLAQAHDTSWMVYYLEAGPVLPFLAALGLAAAFRRLERATDAAMPRTQLAMLMVIVAAGALTLRDRAATARGRAAFSAPQRRFITAVESLPGSRPIVFVRYAPGQGIHQLLVQNHGDLARAPYWLVHDLGERNAELLRAEPGRAAFLYDGVARRFVRTAR